MKTKNKARILKCFYVFSIIIALNLYNKILIASDLIGYIVFGAIITLSIVIGYYKHRSLKGLIAIEYIANYGPIIAVVILSFIYTPKYMINSANYTQEFELPLIRYDRRHRSFDNYFAVFRFKDDLYTRWATGFTFKSKLLKNGTYEAEDCYITLKTINYLPHIYIIEELIISKKE